MSSYVLFIFLVNLNYGTSSMSTIDFTTKSKCIEASEKIKSTMRSNSLKVLCIEKGN